MNAGRQIGGWAVALTAGVTLSVSGQATGRSSPGGRGPAPMGILSSGRSDSAGKAEGELVREIDDPHTGARWLLTRSLDHRGGPGRLVLLPGPDGEDRRERPAGQTLTAEESKELTLAAPVIHLGDTLTVEEDTAVVSSRLQAVALAPAAIGSAFAARLKIGNRIVQALALGPGRAAFLGDRAVRP